MSGSKSKKVCKGTQEVIIGVQVYEAIVLMKCEGCGYPIYPEDWFTRKRVRGSGQRLFPFCGGCEPFSVGGVTVTEISQNQARQVVEGA